MPKLLARFKVNTTDTLSVYKAVGKQQTFLEACLVVPLGIEACTCCLPTWCYKCPACALLNVG
jgi:hypothetical protein